MSRSRFPGPAETRTSTLRMLAVALVVSAAASIRAAAAAPTPSPAAAPAGGYVGRAACVSCHPQQAERFSGSHHDRAMQVADPSTVLGDFNNATFTYNGVTSTFYKKDGGFFVRTDGPDG